MTDQYDVNEKRIRDALILGIGVFGSINEIWFQQTERPYVLAFLAAMVGVPFILHADGKRRQRNGNGGDPE